MFFWFAGGAIACVWVVLRDPAIDYRLVVAGALLPNTVDYWFKAVRPMHSVLAPMLVLAIVMLATIGRRHARRALLAVPFAMFLHLVLDGTWSDKQMFWWPLLGRLDQTSLPTFRRDVLLLAAQELAGMGVIIWFVLRFKLSSPLRRRQFVHSGRLDRSLVS